MKTVVIGLDPSSKKIAMAISIGGRKPTLRKWALNKDLVIACFESYRAVRRAVRLYTQKGYRVVLFIEEPVVGRGGVYSTLRQAKTHGAMVAGGMAGGAAVRAVNNQSWKKGSVGKGNASKDQIRDWLRDSWQVMYLACEGDQDLMDALGILRYGETVVARMDKIDDLADMSDMELAGRRTSRRR